MRIALIGTRGVPARYGGFETCAEELGRRLAARGHDVRVYCRMSPIRPRLASYLGMSLVHLPAIRLRSLETLSHVFLALLHALVRKNDVILVFNYASSPLLALPAWLGRPIILHMDGMEWARQKWAGPGRLYFGLAERLAVKLPIPLISDARAIQSYYREKRGRETIFLSYGAPLLASRTPEMLDRLGLKPRGYFLQMARFEPENNIHMTLRAFGRLETDKQLVLIGGSAYKSRYMEMLDAGKDPRVRRLGFCYDPDLLRELLCHSYAYIHGNEAGGTNPGLLQAMAAGSFVIARDVVFNREVAGDAARYYPKTTEGLRAEMAWTLDHPGELEAGRERARAAIRARYDWDRVTDGYEALFRDLRKSGGRGRVSG
jgi:glycosyltransferase involved in cell wall biosynthesis